MVHVVHSLRTAMPAHNVLRARQAPAPTTPTTTATMTTTPATPEAPDFRALFTAKTTSTASTTMPSAPPPPPAPTAESVFGPNPWMASPTGVAPNGATYGYNPHYFATPQTASIVAQMVGGKVVQSNQFTPNGGPFQQQQPNNMVQLPDGRLINPGLVASIFTHGYPQSYVDMLVACEVKNA